jgi:hypothetical protein
VRRHVLSASCLGARVFGLDCPFGCDVLDTRGNGRMLLGSRVLRMKPLNAHVGDRRRWRREA